MPAGNKRRPILVVDDDGDVRGALRDTLEVEGYQVVEATDGLAALRYIRSHPMPPLVLLDWNMAPMNGPQFMTELLKEPGSEDVAVVLLTADAKAPDKAKTSRYVTYLSKPVNLDKLFEIVIRYLGV